MTVRIGINGFGRIGRMVVREATKNSNVEIVAINDLVPSNNLAYLLKYDSTHGRFNGEVVAGQNSIGINSKNIECLSEKNPANLPWRDLKIDYVIESTGLFTDRENATEHLNAGAKKVVISAPTKSPDIKTLVMGVNHKNYEPDKDHIISNASCTTNCLAPIVKVVLDKYGIEEGLMTTVHAYTGDQSLVDGPHSDLRRARASAINIIPTSTGAARATGLVLQAMNGKLDGISLRVPIPDGSITDFTAVLAQSPSVEEINAAFKGASESGALSGVLDFSDRPLVSSDIVGNPASCVFDSGLTMTMDNLVKVSGWYDNEWGYSNRLVDLVSITSS